MVAPYIPAASAKPDEKAARALEYIAGRLGSIDETLLKLLKAIEQTAKKS
jgi:hypothetical protein